MGMEPSGGEENLAPLLQFLDTVNLPQYQEQPEVVQLGEEIIITVDDPDLIRLLAVESNELPPSSSSYVEHQTFLEDGLSQVELEDVDWVPPEEESRLAPSAGEAKKGEKKHRKGRLQTPLSEIRKENQPNVKRCREYRSQKKLKEIKKLTDLEQLELENKELKMKEEQVKEKLDRVQN